jgi:hypothetical protein
MTTVQTISVNNKEFVFVPKSEFQKLLDTIEDLRDIAEIKKRKNQVRVPFDEVKSAYMKKVKK